jgi:ElaA protein
LSSRIVSIGSGTLRRVTGPDVHIAAFDDLDPRTAYLLWQLREAVFVVEQRCPYPELDGRDLEPGTRHVWLEDDSSPVGYLRIVEDGELARIGRVLVAQTHRGTGLAETLMRCALEQIGDRPSHLDAQSYLAVWYQRFGYAPSGEEFLEDGIPHIPMVRQGPAGDSRTTGA